jgi:1,4-dihydroxy-2-naphthoate octaprenyltransferase
VWVEAARPKTLPAGCAPVLIGSVMALEARGFHLGAALCALLGALLIQIGTNYANDYFDFVKGTDTEKRIGPTRATAAGLVPPKAMLFATVLVFGLVFLPGAYLIQRGGIPILVIGVVSIACGILYTGGPWPLGYLGLGDLFVLVFFGPVAVAGTYYVQTQSFAWAPVFAGLGPGLFSTAILTVNNLRDIEGDRASGKKTLAVRFGRAFPRFEYVICLVGACLGVPLLLHLGTGAHRPVLVSVAALILGLPLMLTACTRTDGPTLNALLARTGKLLLLFSLLFSVGWIL